jgi:cytoskeletal protein RodZ
MKKHIGLVLLLLFALAFFAISGCGGGTNSSSSTSSTSTSTSSSSTCGSTSSSSSCGSQPADFAAAEASASQIYYDTISADIAYYGMLYSDEFSLSSTKSAGAKQNKEVIVPTPPVSPPTIPSGSPNLTKNNTKTYGALTSNVDWYYYFSLTGTKTEWKGTDTYQGQLVDTIYGELSQPTIESQQIKRTFVTSRWTNNNTFLATYTVGDCVYSGTDNSTRTISGTQVLYFPQSVGGKNYLAYTFSITSRSDGSMDGSITFDNATATFTRSAIDESAIGTSNLYAKTTGQATITMPLSTRQVSFENSSYGDGSLKISVTTGLNIATILNYNPDNSGTGTITGLPNRSVTLQWNSSGEGTATIVKPLQTLTVPVYVPRPQTPLLPVPPQ